MPWRVVVFQWLFGSKSWRVPRGEQPLPPVAQLNRSHQQGQGHHNSRPIHKESNSRPLTQMRIKLSDSSSSSSSSTIRNLLLGLHTIDHEQTHSVQTHSVPTLSFLHLHHASFKPQEALLNTTLEIHSFDL
mmetsp:Transcript_16404/g.45122  ORF Transcript_16404/g.45122 Transcript_16404/m.45122 type:complete len:131 (+) Transcript_16404:455-847(+)